MLTSEQAIVEYKQNQAIPDRLTQQRHAHYTQYAERMLEIYRAGIGMHRGDLHQRVKELFYKEPDCPPKRIAAFCKLLDDESTFVNAPDAWQLRMAVFTQAAKSHPLVENPDRLFEHDPKSVKQTIADTLHRTWDDIEDNLYADVLDQQKLESFEGYPSPAALLSRYNVAQLQACLYKAMQMTVRVSTDFKTVLRYIKLCRLLHEITRVNSNEYQIRLAGPASATLATRRYGVNMARFLPALLACKGWRLSAELQTPWQRRAWLNVSDQDGFRSHLPPPEEFDSSVEQNFAEKFGPVRDGWSLIREGAILHHRQKTFVPDFLFRHEDGTEVLMEIVGFWTPEYLSDKRATLREFSDHHILLAVQEGSLKTSNIPENVIPYKTVLRPAAVLEALERFRQNNS